MIAFGASCSGSEPTVTHPCDSPVPGASECTTAKPRGTHVATSELETFSRTGLKGIGGLRGPRRRHLTDFLFHVPEKLPIAGCSREVRRRFVEDRNFEPFSLGLFRPGDVDEHAIVLAVAVGIELGLDPQRLANPCG